MKKLFGYVLVLAIVGSLMTGLLSGCSDDSIKIGHLAQLAEWVGQTSDKALRAYVDEINAAGGINGKKVKLVSYDTQGEAAQAANLVKRFVEKDDVLAIIGPEWSGGAIPLASVTADLKVPVVATTATNEAVTVDPETGKAIPWLFRVCFIDSYQGFALADYAYNDLGLRKASILRDVGDPYAKGVAKFFSDQFTKLGGEVVADEGYMQGDLEFRAQLTTIASKNGDCLLIPSAQYRDAGNVAKQLKDLGVSMTLLGADAWVSDDLLTLAGPELQGCYVSSLTAIDAPEFKAYNENYVKKNGVNPTVFSYMAMDAFMLIEDQIRNKNVTTREEMREALENAKDVKVFTTDGFTIDSATHNPFKRPVVMMTIDNSQWKVHKTYVPQ